MRAGRSKTIINKSYKLHDHPLQSTYSVKYLGLTLTSDLEFNTHINNAPAKANSILRLLRRNLKISSQTVKTQAYQSLVRPHLEYDVTVWSPHTSDNIKRVGMVRRRTARYMCNHWDNTSSVSEMVGHLGWESLAIRRNYRSLHMMYRTTHMSAGGAWQRWLMPSTSQTRGFHPWMYIPLSPSNDPYKFSFLPSTIPVWNNLPPHVISSTMDSFRRQLTHM